MINNLFSVHRLVGAMRAKGYRVYDRPFELNIVAERNNTVRSESFDDTLHLFYKDSHDDWVHHEYLVTTDPNVYYIDNPAHAKGYGFIKKGQWLNAYQLGYHKTRKALVQVRPITVIRNYDLKGVIKRYTGEEHTGIFGNNIHDRKGNMLNASAGCVVFAHDEDYRQFLAACEQHKTLYGNQFTLTLFDWRDARKTYVSAFVYTAGLAGIAVGGLMALRELDVDPITHKKYAKK